VGFQAVIRPKFLRPGAYIGPDKREDPGDRRVEKAIGNDYSISVSYRKEEPKGQ